MPESELIRVEHEGHEIVCIAYPNAEATRLPVIWIHGLTMSVRFWEAGMFDAATEGRSWYSISLPLHFPSGCAGGANPCEIDEALFAELLAESIDRCVPGGGFHLVGHSLGGFSALNYAAKYPGRVVSVISIGGFMRGRARGIEGALQFLSKEGLFRKLLFEMGFRFLGLHWLVLKAVTFAYARDWDGYAKFPALNETLKMVFPDVRRHSILSQRAFCRYLLEMDLFDEVAEIRQPVLVVAGEKDPIIPYQHQRECAEALPAGELLSLPGVGHLAFAEAPAQFVPALVEWLERHE